MPLIVSGCGELECNGAYYQYQNSPRVYVQTNGKHKIFEEIQTISQGYGGSYKQKVWQLQKLDTYNDQAILLYITYQNNNNKLPTNNNVKWKSMAGILPTPIIRNGNMVKNEPKLQNTNNNNNINKNINKKRTFGMLNDCDYNMNGIN
eukprot:56134_1